MAKKLEMTFKDAAGKTMRISVDNADDNLTPEAVKTAMEGIIAKDVFATEAGSLIAIQGARIVDTTIQEMDMK
ncbi:DUF2922 domain-containing protein [Lutispora sp.]|uniref:DUF2922 domain-containing protein n=1 Tax=Lutispora sp. TaxID=2828727 RepID=UPI000EC7BC86|nr:DUF2922 domain-containing protein [Lutispora sp.]MEA4962829.1 DUF2922 domain-containing protein [Lutispora sp.]HCJ57271.1 DUF2922 domain-containing protein [Clostridiaceae bacterium]